MGNPEKLATYGTQDEDKQNKDTTQYVLDTITTTYLEGLGWLNELGSRCGFASGFVNYKKSALDLQSQVIKFMVGGSLRVLRLLPPLNLVAVILYLKYC